MVACDDSDKRKKRIKQFYIPEEIIRSILVKIPAQINYNVMRHVCTKWRDIILHDSGFIYTHLRHSIHGMLLCGQEANYFYKTTTTNINSNGQCHDTVITTSKLDSIIDGSTIHSTCNGLVLYSKTDSTKSNVVEFHVANPTTKQDLVLPSSCFIPHYYHKYYLGFASGTGEYKVVRVCLIHVLACEIRTLGPDQGWRSVDTTSLSADVFNYNVYSHSVGAFIHWIDHDHTHLLSLNLETETFRKLLINVPRGDYRKCLVMGDKLTLFVKAKRPVEVSFEIWILMEGKSNGAEWMKIYDILLPKSISKGLIYPIAWLKPMELVVFYITSFTKIYIAHDFRTGKIHRFSKKKFHISLSFVNSLVWINT